MRTPARPALCSVNNAATNFRAAVERSATWAEAGQRLGRGWAQAGLGRGWAGLVTGLRRNGVFGSSDVCFTCRPQINWKYCEYNPLFASIYILAYLFENFSNSGIAHLFWNGGSNMVVFPEAHGSTLTCRNCLPSFPSHPFEESDSIIRTIVWFEVFKGCSPRSVSALKRSTLWADDDSSVGCIKYLDYSVHHQRTTKVFRRRRINLCICATPCDNMSQHVTQHVVTGVPTCKSHFTSIKLPVSADPLVHTLWMSLSFRVHCPSWMTLL